MTWPQNEGKILRFSWSFNTTVPFGGNIPSYGSPYLVKLIPVAFKIVMSAPMKISTFEIAKSGNEKTADIVVTHSTH